MDKNLLKQAVGSVKEKKSYVDYAVEAMLEMDAKPKTREVILSIMAAKKISEDNPDTKIDLTKGKFFDKFESLKKSMSSGLNAALGNQKGKRSIKCNPKYSDVYEVKFWSFDGEKKISLKTKP